jgi:YegS/Rv2252/BmrU family lipid kinase
VTPAPQRFRILVNPLSGGGSAPATVARVEQLLVAEGATVVVENSRGAEHSRTAVAEAVAAGEIVVAAGGDGMLASLAGQVVASGGVLGIIPSGRGNDFARMLGLDGDPAAVARCLMEGHPTPVDVIRTGDRVVLGSMYAGVDSLASELVDRARRLPAAVQYPYASVRALLTYRPAGFTVTVDGTRHQQEAYNVVVANSGYYGKGMRIAPAADVHDGLLDVVVLPAGSRLGMLRRLPRVYDGSHVELDGVTVLRGREVTVEADRGVVAYGDGELLGPLPRTAVVDAGAIPVLLRQSSQMGANQTYRS